MNNSRAVVAMVAIALVIAIGATAGRTANASHVTPVSLGAAGSYAAFAAATITSSGPTIINGDLGLHPGTSVTGGPTVNGTQNVANAAALSARTLLRGAYADAAGRTSDATVTGDTLGGRTFVSGVYSGGALDLSTALPIVTLDGENDPTAVFIFQAASTLITAASTTVTLIRGAQACNVFWQVGSSATLGASSTFQGTILAHTSISVGTSANVAGRLLAGVAPSSDATGALTLLSNTITRPTCAVAPTAASTLPPCEFMANLPNAPCAGTRPTATTQASATQTPSTPTVAPTAAAVATATPTVAPSAPTVAPSAPTVAPSAPTATPAAGAAGIAGIQVLPSTSTGDPFSPLLMLGIALMGTGALVLRRKSRHQ
jgi:LPXTG-motif cell wall-anchored protein